MKSLTAILCAFLLGASLQAQAQTTAEGFEDPTDQFRKALHYLFGSQGEEKSPARAVDLFRDLAERDFAAAQHMLGTLYEKGDGVDQDLSAAWYWYQRAAANGFVSAQGRLARLEGRLSEAQRADAEQQLLARGDTVF